MKLLNFGTACDLTALAGLGVFIAGLWQLSHGCAMIAAGVIMVFLGAMLAPLKAGTDYRGG